VNNLDPEFKPLLRQVDLFPGEFQGQQVVLLRDPVGIVDEVIALPQGILFLLALMDGEHDLRDLQAEATKRTGQIVPLEEIVKLVSLLDAKGFLWSKSFEEIKERAYQAWFQQRLRLMAHANMGYPLEQDEAKAFLDKILSLSSADGKEASRILIAPHIDLRVGAKAYAEAYKRFKPQAGSRVIILGVGHYLDFPYSVLTKDIATPFGILRNDRGGLLYLTNSKKLELFPDHIAHKLEHSIEFQALFLHHLFGDDVVVLPVLIGSHRLLFSNEKLIDGLVEGLLDLLDERSYIVLGIDFCHLGLRYGDPVSVDENLAQSALKHDRDLLELAFSGKVKELEDFVLALERMKVCGASALYILSKLISKGVFQGKGEIFYQEVLPFGEGSAVSVASAGYII
jgi:AmmeMemoRadiSam system protein B